MNDFTTGDMSVLFDNDNQSYWNDKLEGMGFDVSSDSGKSKKQKQRNKKQKTKNERRNNNSGTSSDSKTETDNSYMFVDDNEPVIPAYKENSVPGVQNKKNTVKTETPVPMYKNKKNTARLKEIEEALVENANPDAVSALKKERQMLVQGLSGMSKRVESLRPIRFTARTLQHSARTIAITKWIRKALSTCSDCP